MKPARVIRLHPRDDVVVALDQLIAGVYVASEAVTVSGLVPPGHKMATRTLAAGEPVRRYGQIIGFASQPIRPGQHVHSHNLSIGDFVRDYAHSAEARATTMAAEPATFLGIPRRRQDRHAQLHRHPDQRELLGHGGARDRRSLPARHPSRGPGRLPHVDGVVALTHHSGCAMDAEGDGLKMLQRTLGGYACHPNFAGVLIIGLGCETNQIPRLLATQGLAESPGLRTFTIQDSGAPSTRSARESS